jgi:hypothetical protein
VFPLAGKVYATNGEILQEGTINRLKILHDRAYINLGNQMVMVGENQIQRNLPFQDIQGVSLNF